MIYNKQISPLFWKMKFERDFKLRPFLEEKQRKDFFSTRFQVHNAKKVEHLKLYHKNYSQRCGDSKILIQIGTLCKVQVV